MGNKRGRPKKNISDEIEANEFTSEVEVRCQCGSVHKVARTWDVLELVNHIAVNFCPDCEDQHQGEKWEENMVIKYRTLHGFRHRFGLHPVVNGREIRLHYDREENFVPKRKFTLWKGYLRNIRNEDGTYTWRYIDECICGNRRKGEDWGPFAGRCVVCRDAIPTAAEKREKKRLYEPKESDKVG